MVDNHQDVDGDLHEERGRAAEIKKIPKGEALHEQRKTPTPDGSSDSDSDEENYQIKDDDDQDVFEIESFRLLLAGLESEIGKRLE